MTRDLDKNLKKEKVLFVILFPILASVFKLESELKILFCFGFCFCVVFGFAGVYGVFTVCVFCFVM